MAPDEKKAYKKRVIKEDSDEESDGGDQAVPLVSLEIALFLRVRTRWSAGSMQAL